MWNGDKVVYDLEKYCGLGNLSPLLQRRPVKVI